jgi:phosphatidylserine decarboxylase
LKFAREGYFPAAIPAVAGLLCLPLFGAFVGGGLMVFALAVLLFFRDPKRRAPEDPRAIISPADGKVVGVGRREKGHHLAGDVMNRVSIFMSPLDVHINRMPVAGTVKDVEWSPGQFRAAYADDASEINESNALLVEAASGFRMVIVQIAGWLARRIICRAGPGDKLSRGEKFGLIMFGSRVDLYLPDDVTIKVRPGERVWSGTSVIALSGGRDESSE